MKYLFFLFFSINLVAGEIEQLSRLNALKVLGDHQLALQEARLAISSNPKSTKILYEAIKIFANAGEEEQMMQAFRKYQSLNKDDPLPRNAIEEMAWGVIEKGAKGNAPISRAIALIAAAQGNDSRGVKILLEMSQDPHRLIRGLVVEFSSHFRDESLKEMIIKRLSLEKDSLVRAELIRAVGLMKISELEPYLLHVLDSDRTQAEEKSNAIASLLDLKEKVNLEEIQKLIESSRASHRALAARLIGIHDKQEDAELLIPLLKDSHAEVRKSALETLGALRVKELKGISLEKLLTPQLNDLIPEVAITASWVLMLYKPEAGQTYMKRWLESSHADERLYAACALKASGKYGFPLTLDGFKSTEDPYVKLNLGIAMIQEKMAQDFGAQAIYDAITKLKERLMQCECGRFNGIGPNIENHRPDIPHYPEAVNQMTRLELLNLLAINHYPGALDAVLQFLKERPWGITGAASALLLTEGDEESLVLIRELLKNDSEKVQLQSALILALWGNDPHALDTLQKLYFKVSHHKKEQIIEALGRIGDFSSLSFLVDRLEESHRSLRLIAAAALLQILYH